MTSRLFQLQKEVAEHIFIPFFTTKEGGSGLDPLGIEELRELIRSFPCKGITVILSSHILSEVQQIADHVGIIAGGVLGYEGELRAGEDLEHLFMDVIRRNGKEGY